MHNVGYLYIMIWLRCESDFLVPSLATGATVVMKGQEGPKSPRRPSRYKDEEGRVMLFWILSIQNGGWYVCINLNCFFV